MHIQRIQMILISKVVKSTFIYFRVCFLRNSCRDILVEICDEMKKVLFDDPPSQHSIPSFQICNSSPVQFNSILEGSLFVTNPIFFMVWESMTGWTMTLRCYIKMIAKLIGNIVLLKLIEIFLLKSIEIFLLKSRAIWKISKKHPNRRI